MSTCDTCPLREWCYERRGICKSYIDYAERVERTQKEIERLNEVEEKTAGRPGSNTPGKSGD